jgi:hypothetical protein
MKRHHQDTLEDDMEAVDEESPGQWHGSAAEDEGCHVTSRRRLVDPSTLSPKQLDRVMKNRQAAQASRDRKKAYVTQLEASNDRLKTEARDLRTRVHVLEQEKDCLSDEVSQLKSEFDQLRALLLARLQAPTPASDDLVDERHSPSHVAPVSPPAEHRARGGSISGIALRPADSPATRVHFTGSSPSVRIADHLLGARHVTNQQLPSRSQQPAIPHRTSVPRQRFSVPVMRLMQLNHLYRQGHMASVAPLTRHLLSTRQAKAKNKRRQTGGTPGRVQRQQQQMMKMGSSFGPRRRLTIQRYRHTNLSSTWTPRRMSLSDLMNLLISKYQPK